ncbi:MAG: TsaD/Kae1/Qri7 protein, required for threonylcarbamoyladenosine t(6)A37 formation in tRNA [uncultured Campylobacterales bacterium]|uniref:tRNA N6-adenosine threonylcarbamoyltransferase n=1 Tax=uncultured Campylobacterales bacterium TaxID=352960 RepID=A0A6S6SQ15_9BACT|nr:MAG: TsaD/Kae1/Qri7 protein, required for threonylcarbamoyladenosine t(6)A37 formation in tRNA [uncultured Campylobacterales bacterium]
MKNNQNLILAIESSCDDSSIAIMEIETKKLLFHKKISQDLEHSAYGGVVPELAARLHAETLPKILDECKEYFPNLRAVGVTTNPGLMVSLLEGIMMAKAISISLSIPLIEVNHLKGHIYSLFINKDVIFPINVLLVSGGHTQFLEVNSRDDIKILLNTLDDSFGESFDKVSKMLGGPYPGGPTIEKWASEGDNSPYKFTVPLMNSNKKAFSYSGLKNQVRLQIQKIDKLNSQEKNDIAYAFQSSAIEHLLHKSKKILQNTDIKDFAIVGGASANSVLRQKFEKLCKKNGIKMHLAPLEYCSDNAAMIARYAISEM